MSSWCFVHAADLHLDTPFDGVGRVDPEARRRLRDASLAAFENLVTLTLERDAAFLVMAGDVYDGIDRGARAQLALLDAARRLAAADVRLFIVHGNHDPLSSYDAVGRWPENVTVFASGDPQHVVVERRGEQLAVVAGVSFATRREPDNLAARFRRLLDADLPHVAVLHANVGAHAEHGPYAPATVADLAATRFDYWALGHVHTRHTPATLAADGFWAVYPGNLQGRSPRLSEQGAKGAVVVDVEDGRIGAPTFVALDVARFAQVDVAIDDTTTLGSLRDELERGADEAVAASDGRTIVLRAVVAGNGPLYATLQQPDTTDVLLAELRARAEASGDDLVWTAVVDRSGPPLGQRDVSVALDVVGGVEPDDGVVTAILGEVARHRDEDDEPLDGAALLDEARELARLLLRETSS